MYIKVATTEDAESIQMIYAPYVERTAVTFEYEAPGADDFRYRIANTLKEYRYLVAVEQERIIGYAYAGAFHSRAAYRHSAEVSIYLAEEKHRQGVGRLLYQELEKRLLLQNVYVLYACITSTERENDENLTDASIRFHEKMGYTLVGRHNLCGYKFDKWYSVVWMEKSLADRTDKADAFVPFSAIKYPAVEQRGI